MPRDYTRLIQALSEDYRAHSPRSAALESRAETVMVDGGSHAIRLIQPFPPRIVRAQGAYLEDEDGHRILDFWQGHFANILGHNPEVVTGALAEAFGGGWGLQTGFSDRTEIEAAEILCRQTGAERVRFTTSGTLATMYAILLSRAATGREVILKVTGGWHGAQPWGLKGVHHRGASGFDHAESLGLPAAVNDQVLLTKYNDLEMLEEHFRRTGDRIACFIVEPFLGSGGGIPARVEYLQAARRLTEQYGAALIFDEVIAGFRFRAGDLGGIYGIRPDLATFGKIMGGGMPVTAVAGRAAVMDLVGRPGGSKVAFSGGTYSAHPASLLAAKTMMGYLAEHESEIYPHLAELGRLAVRTVEAAFAAEGLCARCTGLGGPAGGSLVHVQFPLDPDRALISAEDAMDPASCDHVLSDHILQLALLLEDVHTVHGLGGLSAAHTAEDVELLGEACRRAARRVAPYVV